MSIPFQGFCGPSYQLTNKYAAVERSVNWRCIANEAAEEETKFKFSLEPTQGNAQFGQLPVPVPFNQPCRGLLELNEQVFGVNGTAVYYLDPGGVYHLIGGVADDRQPVSMAANNKGQIFIASAGNGYVILAGGTALVQVTSGFLGSAFCTAQDGYIINIIPNSKQIQVSGTNVTPIGDATQWDPANESISVAQSDNFRALISSRQYLRIFGYRRTSVWFDSGNVGFPFQPYNDTIIETGLAATHSVADMGDSLMWIGQDARGMVSAWRDFAFQPHWVSNFAVDTFWQRYATVADAVAFSYVWEGHLIYRVTFPSATRLNDGSFIGATWEHDATVSQLTGRSIWTELSYQTTAGFAQQRSEMFHAYAYGSHLVGSAGIDGNPGAIYQMLSTAYTDCGVDSNGAQTQRPIVRDRICPHLWKNNDRINYSRFELEVSRGTGLSGAGLALGTDPTIAIRWSNDGGNTWGREWNIPVGEIGQFSTLIQLNRTGYARDRVFWVRYSDPTYMGLVNAMLDVQVEA